MIGAGCLEKLLKVIIVRPHLAPEVVLSSGDELLVGVADLLVIVTLIAAGSDHNSSGSPIQLPLVAFGVPLCALAGCLEHRASITTRGRPPTVPDEIGTDRLLARGVPGGNVEQLLRGIWLIMAELMHEGSTVHTGPECRDDVDVTDLGELVTFLGEMPNVILQGLALLLLATVQIPGVIGPHVCAL
jgi:hypothetical protein